MGLQLFWRCSLCLLISISRSRTKKKARHLVAGLKDMSCQRLELKLKKEMPWRFRDGSKAILSIEIDRTRLCIDNEANATPFSRKSRRSVDRIKEQNSSSAAMPWSAA